MATEPLDYSEWEKQYLVNKFDVGGILEKNKKYANNGVIDTDYEKRQVEKHIKQLAKQGQSLMSLYLQYKADNRDTKVNDEDINNAKTMILAQIEAEKASQELTDKVVSGNFPLIMISVVVIVGFIMFK